MGDSLANDYFSFMSDKSDPKRRLNLLAGQISCAKKPAKPAVLGDTIDFVAESQIEVIETATSDTIIEKLFNLRRRLGTAETRLGGLWEPNLGP
jgi:hypothetical protein